MNIEEIKKINVEDGDIIIFPTMSKEHFTEISGVLRNTFSNKKFVVLSLNRDTLHGIRVLKIKEEVVT